MATRKQNDRTPVKQPGKMATRVTGPDKFTRRSDSAMRGKKGK